MFCSNCGNKRDGDSLLCTNCGLSFIDNVESSKEIKQQSISYKKNFLRQNNKKIIIVFFLLITVGGFLVFKERNTPEQTVREFLSAVNKLDEDKVLDLVYLKDFDPKKYEDFYKKKLKNLDDFEEFSEDLAEGEEEYREIWTENLEDVKEQLISVIGSKFSKPDNIKVKNVSKDIVRVYAYYNSKNDSDYSELEFTLVKDDQYYIVLFMPVS